MKKLIFLSTFFLLSACSPGGHPPDAAPSEINMAEMMGITVEELRNQTPEEHMRMMMELASREAEETETEFLPGLNIDVNTLPLVQETETIDVDDGDTIELSPTIVRKEIYGKSFPMYGYNGQIPGPIIRATQGATITVNVTNDIDMDTTIHWHGLRLDNANDGVPDLTQEAIKPDGSYSYQVTFPDEGIYWYHPHVREDIQQDMGLYGNLLVLPENDDAYAPVNHEQVLVFDDLMLDRSGEPVPYGSDDATFPLMGRFGNTILVNGEPAEEYTLQVERGAVVRFYLTNVANTRTFHVQIDGGMMKLVGSDVGRYEHEERTEGIVLAPAERAIVDVRFEDDGQYPIRHVSPQAIYQLGTVVVTAEDAEPSYEAEFNTFHTHDDVVADIDAYRPFFDKEVDKTLELTIDMRGAMAQMDHSNMMHHSEDGIEWEDTMPGMNRNMTGEHIDWKMIDSDTGDENMDIKWSFDQGDIAKVRIINREDSAHPMQHPIHFHGQRFIVLSVDGEETENLVWKDTVLVPTGSTVDLLFDMSNPGKWMFHCHIAEHLTNGMMGMFTVTE